MSEYSSITTVLNELQSKGVKDSLKITKQGTLQNTEGLQIDPSGLSVIEVYRFEGESNPSDMSALYLVEFCTPSSDTQQATLVVPFGANVDKVTAQVVERLPN